MKTFDETFKQNNKITDFKTFITGQQAKAIEKAVKDTETAIAALGIKNKDVSKYDTYANDIFAATRAKEYVDSLNEYINNLNITNPELKSTVGLISDNAYKNSQYYDNLSKYYGGVQRYYSKYKDQADFDSRAEERSEDLTYFLLSNPDKTYKDFYKGLSEKKINNFNVKDLLETQNSVDINGIKLPSKRDADIENKRKIMQQINQNIDNLSETELGKLLMEYYLIEGKDNLSVRTTANSTARQYNATKNEEQRILAAANRALANISLDNFSNGDADKLDYAEYMNNREKEVYNFLNETFDNHISQLFYRSLELQNRKDAKSVEGIKELGTYSKDLGGLLSIPMNLLGGIEGVLNAATYALMQKDGFNYDLQKSFISEIGSALRQGSAENINSEFGKFLYNTALSGVESFVASLIPGGALLLGASAGASAMNDLIDRGATGGQAILGGIVSGVFEGLFEKVSLGRLRAFDDVNVNTFKDVAKNFLKSSFVNATEEAATETANVLYDTLANYDISNAKVIYDKYIASGLSEKEAKNKTAVDLGLQIAEAAASGAIMGGAFASIGGGIGLTKNAKQTKKIYGGTTEGIQALIDEGLAMPKDSEAFKLATKYHEKFNKKGKLSGMELSNLVNANEAAIVSGDVSNIKSAIEKRLSNLGETSNISNLADIITKQLQGEKLSRDEFKTLEKSSFGKRVSNELSPKNIKSGFYSSDWVKDIGTERINSDVYNHIEQENNESANIDEKSLLGYNVNTNINGNYYGGINNGTKSLNQGRYNEAGNRGNQNHSGTARAGKNSWREDKTQFIQRTKDSRGDGKQKVIVDTDKSVLAYIPAGPDNSPVYKAVKFLRNLGIKVVYCDGAMESNFEGRTKTHPEAITGYEIKNIIYCFYIYWKKWI